MPKSFFETIIFSLFAGAIIIPFSAIAISMTKITSKNNEMLMYCLSLGVSAIVGVSVYLRYSKGRHDDDDDDDDDKKTTSTETFTDRNTKGTVGSMKDIWKVGRQQSDDSNDASSANKTNSYNEKPFGSKYYYAHNDSNTTGGYKDGLKLEDYRMNSPRLLSRNNIRVDDEATENLFGNDDKNNKRQVQPVQPPSPNFITITKYLWDDPGDSKGIGTIRIDVLPSPKSTLSASSSLSIIGPNGERPSQQQQLQKYVAVKDINIENVDASLTESGRKLLVTISLADGGDPYQLQIKQLYGDASAVKAVIKQKRVLIKIFKTRKNNPAWPQPHTKI